MLVSVIIPTRNRISYIKQLLVDLKKQTSPPFEIIVVDQSEEAVYLEGCIYLKSDKVGPCNSRNLGVKHSSGEILVFLDDDARVEENFLEEITRPILTGKSKAVAGAMCNAYGEYPRKTDEFLKSRTNNFIKALTNNPDSERSQFTLSLPGACCALLREIFLETGGFDESFDPTGAAEDRDLALNLYSRGYSIWYNSQARLRHIGADSGGSREVGSRSESLDVHTYLICKKYFSEEMAKNLKETILANYRKKVFKGMFELTGFRTRIRQYFRIKHSLK